MDIKPIETVFKGFKFRSRLEARWAVFFETLGIPWEYEKEGYDLNGTWYLPDFFLPTVGLRSSGKPGIWIEVKSLEHKGTAEETAKYFNLYRATGYPLVLYKGIPEYQMEAGYQHGGSSGGEGWWDNYMNFCKCFKCGCIKVEFLESNYMDCPKCGSHCDTDHPDLLAAIEAARQARFEHGERG